jgi:hypothetical protein
MPEPITLNLYKNPASNRLQSGYNPLDPDVSWRVADGYRQAQSFDIVQVSPISAGSGAMAQFKWADPDDLYRVPISWFGGEWPVRLTILSGPASATIGSQRTQKFNLSLDATTGRYIHTMPNDFAELRWQPLESDVGTTTEIRVRLEDNNNRVTEFTWSVTVDRTKSKWIDAVNGSNANAGTFSAPYQTIAFAYALSGGQNFIYRFRAGTYAVDADYALGATKSKSWIARNGETVNFNMDAGLFSNDYTDTSFIGINFKGGRLTALNVRNNWINLALRTTFHKCTFDITFAGTVRDDNPTGIFFQKGAAHFHKKISITDCRLEAGSQASLCCIFGAEDICIRNTRCDDINIPSNNGSMVINLKDGCKNVSVSFCDIDNALNTRGMVTFYNQSELECINQEMVYCAIRSTNTNGSTWSATWNNANGKGTNQYCQRNTLVSGTQYACLFGSPGAGEVVNVSGMLYSSTLGLQQFPVGANNIGQASVQVASNKINADFSYADDIKAANLGITGHLIASPLVT